MMQLNGTARQLIWQLCLYSLITTSNSLNEAFVCRVSRIREVCGPPSALQCPCALPGVSKQGTQKVSFRGMLWERS
jgi:hypothetical protein